MDSPEGVNSFGYCSGCPGCDIRKPGGPDCVKGGIISNGSVGGSRQEEGHEQSLPEEFDLYDLDTYQE